MEYGDGVSQGAPKDFFLKATYIWQMATKWGTRVGRYLLFFEIFFNGVFVRFSTRGVQKHQKTFWGKSMSKTIGRKS
jgi:hypothetical protein